MRASFQALVGVQARVEVRAVVSVQPWVYSLQQLWPRRELGFGHWLKFAQEVSTMHGLEVGRVLEFGHALEFRHRLEFRRILYLGVG